jgi:hypothetical protein
MSNTIQNGKGSKPRSCFSKSYKDNFSEIDWGHGSKNKKTLSNKDQKVIDKTDGGVNKAGGV